MLSSHALAMCYNLEIQDPFFMLLKWKRKEVQVLQPPPTFLLDFMGVAEFRPLQISALILLPAKN